MDSHLASWEAHKGVLRDLYVVQRKKLEEVMQYMKKNHQFSKSKSQYERIFKEWEFRKKLTKGEWDTIGRYITKRQRLGKESAVYIDGIRVPAEKVKRQTQRHGFLTREERYRGRSQTPSLPERVVICTPPDPAGAANLRRYLLPWLETQRLCNVNVFPPNDSLDNFKDLRKPLYALLNHHWGHPRRRMRNAATGLGLFLEDLFPVQESSALGSGLRRILLDPLDPSRIRYKFWLVVFWMSNNYHDPIPWDMECSRCPTIVEDLERLLSFKLPTSETFVYKFLFLASIMEDTHLMRELLKAVWKQGLSTPSDGRLVYFAVRTEDISTLRCLIKAGADVNTRSTSFPKTPLLGAVEQGHAEMVQILLDAGADANMEGMRPHKVVPLLLAVRKNHIMMARMLLEAGANVDIFSGFGATPLLVAIKLNRVEMAQFLIDARADVNIHVPLLSTTPLLEAVKLGRDEMVMILLEAGANVNIPLGISETSPLRAAIRRQNPRIAQVLLDAGADHQGQAAAIVQRINLRNAVSNDDTQRVRSLIEAGADVNNTGNGEPEETVLFIAIAHEDILMVQLLLTAGADPNARSKVCRPPLQTAVRRKNVALVRLLLDSGADSSAAVREAGRLRDKSVLNHLLSSAANKRHKADALQGAIEWNNLKIVRSIIKTSVDVNTPTNEGTSPLQIAAANDRVKAVSLLLDAGANPNCEPSRYGGLKCRTAVEEAAWNGNVAMVKLLIEASARVGPTVPPPTVPAFQVKVTENEINVVKYLLSVGARATAAALDAALQMVSKEGSKELVQTLLAAGVKPTSDASALSAAVRTGDIEIMQTLVDATLDINDPGVAAAALEAAASIHSLDIAQFLVQQGATLEELQGCGSAKSALLTAVEMEDLTFLQFLLAPEVKADVNYLQMLDPNRRVLLKRPVKLSDYPESLVFSSRTALQRAAEFGDMDMVDLLLNSGAEVNKPAAESGGGITALQGAASSGCLHVAVKLLKAGANVNAPASPSGGRTALEAAAQNGRLEMVQLLLNAGAQLIGDRGREYDRAMELASEQGHYEVCKLLKAAYQADREGQERLVSQCGITPILSVISQ